MSAALPGFVGIGALKAGTSYLDQLLRDHPQLSLPRFLKEADYFSRHHDRGPQWYAGLFAPEDGRVRGELSPQYLLDPHCPARVRDANPDARILLSVRHPVARTVSQYRHWVQETGYAHDLATFLVEHPNAVETSRYHARLQPWLDVFGRERVHVVVFEDLIAEPVRTSQQVMRALGVDDTYVPPVPEAPVNATFTPRFPRTYAMSRRVGERLRTGPGARVVHLAKRAGLDSVLTARTDARPAAVVGDEDRARVADELRPDAELLSGLLDRDLVARWGL